MVVRSSFLHFRHATFAPLSVGSFLIDLPLFCSARRNSYRFCKLSQNSALVPKRQPQRRITGDRALAIQNRGHAIRRYAKPARQFRGAHAEFVEFLSEMLPRMNRCHCHLVFATHGSPSIAPCQGPERARAPHRSRRVPRPTRVRRSDGFAACRSRADDR